MTAKHWRTPLIVLVCAGIILTLSTGTRAGFGLFLKPMSMELGWGRETYSFAMALQNLFWGLGTPVAGMIADRWGAGRVLVVGALMYAAGVMLMPEANTGWQLYLSGGVLIGLAQSCTAFAVVFGVLGRAYPPEKRSIILGIASAAGSFGQFAILPYAQTLISAFGWHSALLIIGCTVALIAPLAFALVERAAAPAPSGQVRQSGMQALREALTHRGYLLLIAGYFVCGFQLSFITIHFPAYVADLGFSANVAVTALALVGLFNIAGSFTSGALGQHYPKQYLLSAIYFGRALITVLFITLPASPATIYIFGASVGLLWLATVPLTSGLIAQMFGVAWMSTLTGVALLSHQLGSFLGVWLGGILFDRTGSYSVVWWLAIGLGVLAGLVNLPIDGRPIVRVRAQAATPQPV
jgi:MFS family permease